MAVGVQFREANTVLRAPTPEDAAAGTVYDLHVMRYRDLDGLLNVLSCWQLSEKERAEVARTGIVWFNCWGSTHPPMWLATGDFPFRAPAEPRQQSDQAGEGRPKEGPSEHKGTIHD